MLVAVVMVLHPIDPAAHHLASEHQHFGLLKKCCCNWEDFPIVLYSCSFRSKYKKSHQIKKHNLSEKSSEEHVLPLLAVTFPRTR